MPTVRITFELPAAIADALDPSGTDVSRRALEALLVHLFHLGEISSGRAAEVLGISKADFRQLLHEHEVPYIDMSPEEFRAELEASKRFEIRRSR